MNEGGIRPAVVSICMNLFICTNPPPLSVTAGEDLAALLKMIQSSHTGWDFKPCAGLKNVMYLQVFDLILHHLSLSLLKSLLHKTDEAHSKQLVQ